MTRTTSSAEIPLGVECAWPILMGSHPPRISLRQQRLADAWRRLKAALQPNRRSNWAR